MTLMLGLGRARTNREHRFAAENLSAYIDGELTAAERSRVERHLAACADCRRDVETLQETVALLRRVPLKPVPRSFALPASARAVQARHRRWNGAFTAMRAATVTIATMLMLVFAGDAAISTGLVSLPGSRATSDTAALLAPAEGEALVEEAQPMIAREAPEVAPEVAARPEPEGVVEPNAGAEAAPAEAPPPPETARALQPPRETWPGPDGQTKGVKGGGGEPGGLGGAGGGGVDMGGPVPSMPSPSGAGGGEPSEGESVAALAAETEAESLAQTADDEEAPAEETQHEAMLAPAPTTTPTPGPEPTQPPPAPTVEADAAPTVAAPRAGDTVTSEEAPAPEALAMPAAPEGARAGEPEPEGEVEHVMLLDRQPESPWWRAWRSLRLLVGLLTGMLLIALAGTIWTGYKRGTL